MALPAAEACIPAAAGSMLPCRTEWPAPPHHCCPPPPLGPGTGDFPGCQANFAAGGWGATVPGDEETVGVRIQSRSTYIANNIIYNPPGFTWTTVSRRPGELQAPGVGASISSCQPPPAAAPNRRRPWPCCPPRLQDSPQHLQVDGPDASRLVPRLPPTVYTDNNLVFRCGCCGPGGEGMLWQCTSGGELTQLRCCPLAAGATCFGTAGRRCRWAPAAASPPTPRATRRRWGAAGRCRRRRRAARLPISDLSCPACV